ncbi:MAG TPA: hypothetical protein VNL18_13015, partial [Gemmatimonadales bacterium]|nr:hypothetical protein [Gemmatimonadales bacterium]
GGDTTDFDGVIASDNLSGTISVSVPAALASVTSPSFSGAVSLSPTEPSATVNVTATLKIKGGSNVTLTGTYDLDSKALGLSGGGYTFAATFANGRFSGTFTGPGGGGLFTAFSRRGGDVELFCGTFTGDAAGVWNLARRGNDLVGAFHENGGAGAGTLTGTLSGNSVSLTFTGGTATGTLSGTSMTGSWTASGDNGSWSGSRSGC